ncbi:hypothetical protein NHX12_021285 [Muraenolepis orangiensis]|uniref:Uncharacterized protein n=1 Tax=Muraenolepis orangiensis TaxID=630683 RepID=A0A9Q0EQ58_9TELE|nr:hypothetical protein NHX12_021285 [Muraenolepis orangiensis]
MRPRMRVHRQRERALGGQGPFVDWRRDAPLRVDVSQTVRRRRPPPPVGSPTQGGAGRAQAETERRFLFARVDLRSVLEGRGADIPALKTDS